MRELWRGDFGTAFFGSQRDVRDAQKEDMSIFPRKISWTEPWDWEVRKERIRQVYKELPPMWRMGVYSLIVFAAFVAARIFYPETRALDCRMT